MDKKKATESIWTIASGLPRLATFSDHVDVDVAIVGAGITGLTAAALLKKAGLRVAVFERQEFGSHGTTHRTSAHLTVALDQDYPTLIRKFNEEAARVAIEASAAAIDRIEQFGFDLKIENEFKRVDGYRYTENPDDVEGLVEDFEAGRQLGLDMKMVNEIPMPFKIESGFRIPNQGQFHPVKHLAGLAKYVDGDGSYVFHKSPVRDYEDGDPCHLVLDQGTVTARKLILATHTPIGVWLTLQTRLLPYHSYCIAARLNGPAPEGLFWDTEDPYHYIRRFSPQHDSNGDVLIIGGSDSKTGQEPNTYACFESLEKYITTRFDVKCLEHYWSDQFFEPADGLPYIGRAPGEENVYLATGYSGTGLTYGTAAAMLMSDLILDRPNPWEMTFDPGRIKPLASAKHIAEGAGSAVQGLIVDRFLKVAEKELADIKVDDGKIVSIEGERLAIYRDKKGDLHSHSPVCTHMGCLVNWNASEKHWDCKCHGSLFSPDDGEPIAGPATTPLARRKVTEVLNDEHIRVNDETRSIRRAKKTSG